MPLVGERGQNYLNRLKIKDYFAERAHWSGAPSLEFSLNHAC